MNGQGSSSGRKQAARLRRGAKGCKIFMVCAKKDKNEDGQQIKDDKGEDKKSKVLKALYVFNFDHTEEI